MQHEIHARRTGKQQHNGQHSDFANNTMTPGASKLYTQIIP
jgi:hypothetical protein